MPRKSKSTLRRERLVAELERLAFGPDTGETARSRALGQLTALSRAELKLDLERARERRERAAQDARNSPRGLAYSGLLDNGRGPPGW
jgi:hypothetical protein